MNSFESVFCRERISLLMLLCALSTLVLFDNDREHLSRPGHHSFVSMEHLAIARNLSPAHNFLMFRSVMLESDGTIKYDVHNRFPIGGYALIKLASFLSRMTWPGKSVWPGYCYCCSSARL